VCSALCVCSAASCFKHYVMVGLTSSPAVLCRFAHSELVTQCWAADPLARPPFTTVKDKLEALLSSFIQDEAEAQERFVADL